MTDNERRNDQAHRADESVGVAELVIAAHAYALTAMRLLNRADPVSLEPRGNGGTGTGVSVDYYC